MTGIVEGVVVRVSGWEVLVDGDDGVRRLCQLRGRVKAGPRRSASPVVAGDRVDVLATDAGRGVVETVHHRRCSLARVGRGTRPLRQVLVANLDHFYVVVAARQPPLRPGFIDRALVMASSGGVAHAVIVVNKVDLDGAGERRAVVQLYRGLGYEVLETSAATGEGVAALTADLHRGLSVLVGPSGAGKSTLLNHIEPGLGLRTQELMRHHDRGRHTTTSISLHRIGEGGYVADTPGLKQLQPWGLSTEELVEHFPELAPLHGGCQFRNCTHLHEPGCRVREAVEAGTIAASRYDSYARMHADTGDLEAQEPA